MNYDVIGDIHGQAGKLEALLKKLGYRVSNGTWRHAERTAIFVGDFIDLGEAGLETVNVVRAMVEAGAAQAVMGNHELNAIAWHTQDLRVRDQVEYLRPRYTEPWGKKNRKQHQAFLAQVEHDATLHGDLVDWFLTLPLWLDLPEVRVVHACWHQRFMTELTPLLREGRYLTRELMVLATDEPGDEAEKDNSDFSVFKAVEALTKGIEVPLPAPHFFIDKHQIQRTRVRACWWDTEAATFRQMAKMSEDERMALPDSLAVPENARLAVPTDKPIFFGHYWMKGVPTLQSAAAVCVDYSAGEGGPLMAYRWSGGGPLSADNFVGTD